MNLPRAWRPTALTEEHKELVDRLAMALQGMAVKHGTGHDYVASVEADISGKVPVITAVTKGGREYKVTIEEDAK